MKPITTNTTYRYVDFTVPAVPVAQPRPRATMAGKHARVYGAASKHPVNAFKATVRMAWQEAHDGTPFEGPISVDALFVFPRPKSFPKKGGRMWKATKPDRDNLDKSLLDALSGVAWADDAQVCSGLVQKAYAAHDEAPHVEVTVREMLPWILDSVNR